MKKTMKKTVSILVTVILLLTLAACGGKPSAEPAEPFVSADVVIFNAGEPVMFSSKLSVTDLDGDGTITVCDALAQAHQNAGQPEGFDAPETEFGRSIMKLWGVENSAYGCCINDAMAMSLTDPLADGDYIAAYVFADTVAWSDAYAFFDAKTVDASAGEELSLSVSYIGFDESWNAVVLPLTVTELTIDGQSVPFTASEGGVSFTAPEKGSHIVSAAAEGMTLVPPVCTVNSK